MIRPKAADVLGRSIEWESDGAHSYTPEGLDAFVTALRAAVDAGPNDVIALLPDGTLNVAIYLGGMPDVPMWRIPGTEEATDA